MDNSTRGRIIAGVGFAAGVVGLAYWYARRRKIVDPLPLHTAVAKEEISTIGSLLMAKAPIDGQNATGRTALFLAAEHGHTAAAYALCTARASLDLETFDGCTPLYVAAQQGHVGAVEALLKAIDSLPLLDSNLTAGSCP